MLKLNYNNLISTRCYRQSDISYDKLNNLIIIQIVDADVIIDIAGYDYWQD